MQLAELDEQWGDPWLPAAPVPADLAALLKKNFGGTVPGWAPMLAPAPWVLRAMASGMTKRIAHMPLELSDLISFVVSQDNACRYCYGATRAILRVLGYSESAIDRLERDVELDAIPADQQVALRFARKLTRANPLPDASDLKELADAGFSAAATGEIAYTAAASSYMNRVATLFSFAPESFERMMRNPIVRLLRPFVARQFRGKHAAPVELPAPNEPPFADLIARLGGSPVAHSARDVVDDAMTSSILPRRTKLLVFATVGRALGSPYVVRQAQRGLSDEGMSDSQVDEILQNLGSPVLDPAERIIVPFVRETVRYRNRAIQQRTQDLASQLPLEVVIETVGLASLANSVARLSVLIDS